MSLDSIVQVNISAETTTPTQQGFGIPLIMAYHTNFLDKAREYTSLDAMVTDGFGTTDPAYLAAQACFAQNPRPEKVVVGKASGASAQEIKLTPVAGAIVASQEYVINVNGYEASYTTDASPTAAEIIAGFVERISPSAWQASHAYILNDHVKNDTAPVKIFKCVQAGTSAGSGGPTGTGSGITDGTCKWDYVAALPSVTATDGGTYLNIENDDAEGPFAVFPTDRALMTVEDVTTDGSGIAADIAAVRDVNDDWYCLILTRHSKTCIVAAAAYIETLRRIHIAACADDEILDPAVTDDTASALQTAAYARTSIMYHPKANAQYPAAAWAGLMLPKDPGSATWKFKTLAGVDYVRLTETEESTLEDKDANHYTRVAGVNIAQQGISSAHEFIDVTQGVDWLTARLKERIFARLVNLDKVPFTDKGIGIIEAEVQAQLNEAVEKDVLAEGTTTVTVPLAADVSTVNKANRFLPDVEFTGTLSGAIHSVEVDGVVTV